MELQILLEGDDLDQACSLGNSIWVSEILVGVPPSSFERETKPDQVADVIKGTFLELEAFEGKVQKHSTSDFIVEKSNGHCPISSNPKEDLV